MKVDRKIIFLKHKKYQEIRANKNYKKTAYKTTLKKGNVKKRKWTLFTKKSIDRLDSCFWSLPYVWEKNIHIS